MPRLKLDLEASIHFVPTLVNIFFINQNEYSLNSRGLTLTKMPFFNISLTLLVASTLVHYT